MKTACFTIVSNNYLHFAKTMLDSFAASNPSFECFCVVVDENTSYAAELFGGRNTVSIAELNIPELRHFQFKYTILELNTAVKPWAFSRLIDVGYERIIYLDPDIFVYDALSEVSLAFEAGANIVVTPHLTRPVTDIFRPNELDIRRAGAYNLGFCAINNSSESKQFLEWWKQKLFSECVVDLESGIFVDQSWIDLVPGMYSGVSILRDEGYNVAYWNIGQRKITVNDVGKYYSNGMPLVFFHFSGFDPFNATRFSKHQNRYQLADTGPVEDLCLRYAEKLIKNCAEKYSELKYSYGNFDDGLPVPAFVRKLARNTPAFQEKISGDPFKSFDRILDVYSKGTDLSFEQLMLYLEKYLTRTNDNDVHCSLMKMLDILNKYKIDIEREFGITYAYKLRNAARDVIAVHNSESNLASRRVTFLYRTILRRYPDASGCREYRKYCTGLVGYHKTWKALVLSQESRNISSLMTRALQSCPILNLNPDTISEIGEC